MLALSGSVTVLPNKYYTLEFPFCQWKVAKIAGEAAADQGVNTLK